MFRLKNTALILCVLSLFFVGYSARKNNGSKTQQSAKIKDAKSDEDTWVKKQLSQMSLKEKIGQSFMVACWSNKSEDHLKEIENQVRTEKIGGIIFFQGERNNLVNAIDRFQASAEIPLLIGMDAEWGVAMRIFGEERFPYANTIGAANDLSLTQKLGQHMGIECESLGIHMNFAPDADVNSNPKNPVIGFRAFGADPASVANHTRSFVTGMESTGVISCVKHFPGHGDTDVDSHKELPTVSHSVTEFEQTDFLPFEAGIDAGTRAVMVAHLNVPNLDPSGTPSSLSKPIIQDYLRKKLKFKGLVVSDALNMKAVADKYGKSEVVAKAYIAGCDILLYPESVGEAIDLIAAKVDKGELDKGIVDERCTHVLRAKYQAIVHQAKVKRMDPAPERHLIINQTFEKALTVLKNENNALPINRVDNGVTRITIGIHTSYFRDQIDKYAYIKHRKYFTVEEALKRLKSEDLPGKGVIILDLHSDAQRAADNYGFGDWTKICSLLPKDAQVILTINGNPMMLKSLESLPEEIDACVVAYENHPAAQEQVAQFIMGAFDATGKLHVDINKTWTKGTGIKVNGNGRFKYSQPEELGISSAKMAEIDAVVERAIKAKVFPGCQIVVAIDGKLIHQKSYGTTTYEDGDSITNDHVYDIASITKIASSTISLMKLRSEGKFSPTQTLGELVPAEVGGTDYADLKANDLLTHQAGLTPWIAFYKKTLEGGELKSDIYKKEAQPGYSTRVADNIFIKDDYWKTMLKTITSTALSGKKSYEYSDLSYYFFQRFIQNTSGTTLNKYVYQSFYHPLGLQTIGYLPLERMNKKWIVPTENDTEFRKQVIRGYVHDPGAAMMGGVAGHAGLFSNATDLAALMQLLLNKGQLGNVSLIKSDVVDEFTRCQFCPKNRRGLGFDKPVLDLHGGPTCSEVSLESFGHSGFTGTLAWADPKYKVNFVFLSNRVYPDASNWKIVNMGIRTEIQHIIYEALKEANLYK